MDEPSEDDRHRWASDELEDALLFGDKKKVVACLQKLEWLDGHVFRIIVGQLDGSIPPGKYRIRFDLKQKKGKPPSVTSEPSFGPIIANSFRLSLKHEVNRKTAVSKTCAEFKISPATLESILAQEKATDGSDSV
jgi:hypothetical protein